MLETVIVRGEGITLDLLLWRRYGVRGQSLVEQALEINPGLAEMGPYIPLGTAVTLPDLPAKQTAPRRAVVSLFG